MVTEAPKWLCPHTPGGGAEPEKMVDALNNIAKAILLLAERLSPSPKPKGD